jgi:hypothetical protein
MFVIYLLLLDDWVLTPWVDAPTSSVNAVRRRILTQYVVLEATITLPGVQLHLKAPGVSASHVT